MNVYAEQAALELHANVKKLLLDRRSVDRWWVLRVDEVRVTALRWNYKPGASLGHFLSTYRQPQIDLFMESFSRAHVVLVHKLHVHHRSAARRRQKLQTCHTCEVILKQGSRSGSGWKCHRWHLAPEDMKDSPNDVRRDRGGQDWFFCQVMHVCREPQKRQQLNLLDQEPLLQKQVALIKNVTISFKASTDVHENNMKECQCWSAALKVLQSCFTGGKSHIWVCCLATWQNQGPWAKSGTPLYLIWCERL